jgi:hypothetical protein
MEQTNQNKELLFALLAGVLYSVFGILHIAEGLSINTGIAEVLFISGDILGGACLVIIGTVFLYGSREMAKGVNAGVSFVYVGILLSLVFMAVYILTMGGNLLDSFIVPDDYEGWSAVENFRPGIYLGVLPFMGILYWKNRFSLNEILVVREVA